MEKQTKVIARHLMRIVPAGLTKEELKVILDESTEEVCKKYNDGATAYNDARQYGINAKEAYLTNIKQLVDESRSLLETTNFYYGDFMASGAAPDFLDEFVQILDEVLDFLEKDILATYYKPNQYAYNTLGEK